MRNTNETIASRAKHHTVFNITLNVVIFSILAWHNTIQADSQDSGRYLTKAELLRLPIEELLNLTINSASLLPEKPQFTAASTSTIGRQEWRMNNARRIADAIESFPSTLSLPFRFGAEAIAVRGFAGSNLPRGLSVRWDNVPLAGFSNGAAVVSVPNIDLGTLERIEMVRGPASALYGSDAFHGVLSLYSSEAKTKPLKQRQMEENYNHLRANIGSDEYYAVNGRFLVAQNSSSTIETALAVSGQGDQHLAYPYTDPINSNQNTGHRQNRYESQTAWLKQSSLPNGPVAYHWSVRWNRFDADRFSGPGQSQSPGRSSLIDQDWSGSDTEFLMTEAAISKQWPSGMTTELNSYFWRADVLQQTNVPRAGDTIGENIVDVGDLRYGANLVVRQDQSVLKTKWALSLGHNTMEIDQGHTTLLDSNNTILAEVDERFEGESRHINNILLEIKTSLIEDKILFVYGGRLDSYSDFGTQKTPRLGFIYSPSKDWSYKLLYGKAFRAPTAFETFGVGNFKGNPDLKPETIDTYEWSATKYTDNWVLGFTLFASRWQQGIIRAPSLDPNFRLEFQNAEENKSHGLEAQFEFNGQRWLSNLSASYVESENITLNQQYRAFPRVIINAGLTFRATGDTQISVRNRVQLNASTGLGNDANSETKLPTYWRVDLNVEKKINQKLITNISARNLFNRDNYLSALFNAENGIPDEGFSLTVGLQYQLN